MPSTVSDLLSNPFLSRSHNQKILIVGEGKPQPILRQLKFQAIDLSFLYDNVEWLTGCHVRQELFCWPCLLFNFEKEPWIRIGIKNLDDLQSQIREHEKRVPHIQSSLDLQLFLQRLTAEIITHPLSKDTIQRNREISRRIIDVICVLATEQRPPGTRDKNHLKTKNYIRKLKFLRDYDVLQCGLISDIILNRKIASDMVDAITDVMKASIETELYQSTFVSIILTKHSESRTKSLISVVLRYLRGGEVRERFVKFINTDLEGEKNCRSLFEQIDKVISEFRIAQKIIAFSLDGSTLKYVEHIDKLKDLLCSFYPYIRFIPCHFHKLDHMLQQSLSFYIECDIFFKNVAALGSYFRIGSKRREQFENFLADNGKIGQLPDFDICNSAKFAEVFVAVRTYRKDCISFLEHVLSTHDNMVELDLARTLGLSSFLKDFRTFFFLEIFIKFFSIVSPLAEAFHSNKPERAFDPLLYYYVCSSLQIKVDDGRYSVQGRADFQSSFSEFWETVIEEYGNAEKRVPEEFRDEANKKYHAFRLLYSNITKCIASQVRYRFESSEELAFFDVLNFRENDKRLGERHVKEMILACGRWFERVKLERERKLLESNQIILNCDSAQELIQLFKVFGLNSSCPSTFRLIELVLTLPCSLPNLNGGGSSKLRDITKWSHTPSEHENTGDLSLMCIELDYLEDVRKKSTFYESVMTRFQKRNRALQVMF